MNRTAINHQNLKARSAMALLLQWRVLARPTLAAPLALALIATWLLSSLSGVQAGEGDRLQRALDWPKLELAGYDTVFVEDITVTDPKADERKIRDLVETVPVRMANFVAFSMDEDLFPNVHRRGAESGEKGLILRVNLPQYKPGSQTSRAFLVGTGSAHLNLEVIAIDAASGDELARFTEDRTFAWGGAIGGSRGITLMEENAAKELAAWLSLGKGEAPDSILAKMKTVELKGPPDTPHGTIYIMRPQSFVGAAARFRVGIDDLTLGESKRKRYYVVYAPPGIHEVWWGRDKKKRKKSLAVVNGETYYYEAIGMKPIKAKKGENKLKQCKLAREVNLAEFSE